MSSAPPALLLDRSRPFAAILVGGLAAGALDLASAIGAWLPLGVSPVRIMQSIAAGLYGRDARDGGWQTALVGLGCHFVIAFTAAAVYWLASRRLRFLIERPIISGLLYGEVVYLFMNFVVIPLSAIHRWPTLDTWQSLVTGWVGHLVFVGLPISLAARRYSARPTAPAAPREIRLARRPADLED